MKHREGTLRWTTKGGEEHIIEPGSKWYSTALFSAQFIWSNGKWKPFNEDSE